MFRKFSSKSIPKHLPKYVELCDSFTCPLKHSQSYSMFGMFFFQGGKKVCGKANVFDCLTTVVRPDQKNKIMFAALRKNMRNIVRILLHS